MTAGPDVAEYEAGRAEVELRFIARFEKPAAA